MQNRMILPVLALLLLLFLLFPNANPGADSWYYAACVRYGENLFLNHHLLYNAFGRMIFSGLNKLTGSDDALHLLMVINSFFACGCILVFYLLIRRIQNNQIAVLLAAASASCFGFMRFATDAETYIIPLFFSLLSAYFIQSGRVHIKWLLSGAAGSIAVLFHEIHIWWAAAAVLIILSVKKNRFRNLLLFSLPYIIIPLIYFLIYHNSPLRDGFTAFITGAYGKGQAGLDISFKALLLTIVNCIRTVVQIHGYIPFLFYQWPVISVISGLILLLAAYKVWRSRALNFRLIRKEEKTVLGKISALAFFLHLLFAFLSSGNAEFMVMLPFLFFLWLASGHRIESGNLTVLPAGILLFWNFMTGILPAAKLDMGSGLHQADFQEKHPDAAFMWADRPLTHNIQAYRHGLHVYSGLQGSSIGMDDIGIALKNQIPVYTDLGNRTTKFSRKSFTAQDNPGFLKSYHVIAEDSFSSIYGTRYIFRILPDK